MTTMKKISWATITTLAVALSACGNDDDSNNNPGPAAPNASAWNQLTLLTDCDRGPAATPAFPNSVPLPAPNGGNGTATSTGTATNTSTGTATGTETMDINALNERMQSGNLRCTGSGGANFTVTREGQFTMPDGTTGTLEAAQLEQVRSAADAIFRADANRSVTCENSGQVRDDEAIQANDGAGQMHILYTADRQDRRRCFQGDRAEVERLRQAMAPLNDRYRAMGAPANPNGPVNPANPANPANPTDPNAPVNPAGPNGTDTSTNTNTSVGAGV